MSHANARTDAAPGDDAPRNRAVPADSPAAGEAVAGERSPAGEAVAGGGSPAGGAVRGTRHRIWAMRHGQSVANEQGVVVSKPGKRAFEWAELTALGRAQAERGAKATPLDSATVIITSDFARALQTAQIAAQTWGAAAPAIDTRLRERDFGVLDGGPDTEYQRVWTADSAGLPLPAGVESPARVAARTRSLVTELLDLPGTADIVLVAHGDVLQITQAWLAGVDAAAHRSLTHLENAELRLLLG